MTLNREVFHKDPTQFVIPNDGVTTVQAPQTDAEWNVLRYELQWFVCEGQYRAGLERILSTYLANLGRDKQPAVWVSGFYGSGKSHLVRMLEHYWRNVRFPGGAEARSLSTLPQEITDLLAELSTAGRQHGGLWAAAGKLSNAGGRGGIRADMLRIVLQSAGLPADYATGRFVLWLRRHNLYDDVRRHVEAEGARFEDELLDLYVSPILANALLAANPDFAENQKQAREFIKAQYPDKTELTNEDLFETVRQVLELHSDRPGQIPCALLVFDEMQQAIGEDAGRALEVQAIVEDLCTRLGSRLLVVATGQSAISATPQLQKLQGRFTVRVELSDRDVDTVVREVVLRKDPARLPALKDVLEQVSGEVDRQLGGSRIAPTAADKADLPADYPILPARRRFWERVLRAIDTGTASQLRTQLQTVHQAARTTADKPLGTVIGADFIYEQQKPAMLPSGVLLRDVAEIIEGLDDGTPDGRLRSRLCATIFLIGRLPETGALAAGLRADAATLADLLVEDLRHDGPELRRRVPDLLNGLVDEGKLMAVDGAYLLQTPEGMAWESDRKQQFNRAKADAAGIAGDRAEKLKEEVRKALTGVRLLHGANQTPRKLELHFGLDAPPANTTAVPVWVRDEWSVSEKSVREDATRAGADSPVVFLFLPRTQSQGLTDALAGAKAAAAVLDMRSGQQATPEGQEARSSMESKLRQENSRVAAIVADIVRAGKVYQGGGVEVAGDGGGLAEAVRQAAENALARLFPSFKLTDVPGWDRVVSRAHQGAPDALAAVGYGGDVAHYAPAAELLQFLDAAGKKGSDVQAQFTGVGYGWPKDCVDGLLLALLNADLANARNKAGEAVTAKQIPQSGIGVTTFRREGVVLTASHRLGLRALAQKLGLKATEKEEAAAVHGALQRLLDLAGEASGPVPLPAEPDVSHVKSLQAYTGNEQLLKVYEARDTLAADYARWKALADKKSDRLARWRALESLMDHAGALPDADDLRRQMDAIREQRALLDDPDPARPLLERVTTGLRAALQTARAAVDEVRTRELAAIEATPEWNQLPDATWKMIFDHNQLGTIDPLDVGTDEKLLKALNTKSIAAWRTEEEAIPGRVRHTRDRAAKQLEPQAVSVRPPARTLKTAAEAEAYLADLRADIMHHLDEGHPVLISLA